MVYNKFPFHLMSKPNGPLCNLDCDYCFYLKKSKLFNNKSFMSDEVLENYIKSYINANSKFGEVNFAWQGGEPLISGLDFFKKAVSLQRKYKIKGVEINNSLQTNGTLINDEYAIFFKQNKFLIGVSIDGPENIHNYYRKDIDNNGSFDKVVKGIEKLKEYDVDFNTLTVVHNYNYDKCLEVYNFLKSIGSKYLQFIPIVEIDDMRNLTQRSVTENMFGVFLIDLFKEWIMNDIGKIYISHFDLILGMYLGYPSTLCVHTKNCGNNMIIEHNGNIYSCDHFVNEENYLGNITEEELTDLIKKEKQLTFGIDKYHKLPNKCLFCKYLKLCYGGCPKNRDSKGVNYLCESYFNFYTFTEPYFKAMQKAVYKGSSPESFRSFLEIDDP